MVSGLVWMHLCCDVTFATRRRGYFPHSGLVEISRALQRTGRVTANACTYIHTNLYGAKNRENKSGALAQDDWTVKADWMR